MKEWPAAVRVVVLAGAACALLVALAGLGTRDDPYAPNDWLFSHAYLAEKAIEQDRVPMNRDLLTRNGFAETAEGFRDEVGLERMTFYANTIWHFWNGLPLQPSLLATLSVLAGEAPGEVARAPLGGLAVVLLVYAAADVALHRERRALAVLAPFAVVLCSAPLVLDLRVLMPSGSLVIVVVLLLLLLRRQLLGDPRALAAAMVPLALLPFWYYTVSYFVILLFVGFLAANLALRLLGRPSPPAVPLLAAAGVPVALGLILVLNGALTSHLQMASSLGSAAMLGGEAGGDYSSHLNRSPWRSALVYAQLGLLFVPLALLSLAGAWRCAARARVGAHEAVFAQWSVGGALFSLALPAALGASFLNRSAIYLAPLAAVALAFAAARGWTRAAFLTLAVGAVASPLFIATAAPSYDAADADAFAWMAAHVPQDAVVYSSLDVASVLFREHGFHDALAFHPRTALLEDFWYAEDDARLLPYLASLEWLVLRDDVTTQGFEEFGPLREPISAAAYRKFGTSPDLHRVFDNGEVEVYRVGIARERLHGLGSA